MYYVVIQYLPDSWLLSMHDFLDKKKLNRFTNLNLALQLSTWFSDVIVLLRFQNTNKSASKKQTCNKSFFKESKLKNEKKNKEIKTSMLLIKSGVAQPDCDTLGYLII